MRLEAPKTHRFEDLPPDLEVDGGAFGRATQSFSRKPGRGPNGGEIVVLERRVALEKWRVSSDEYARWRDWLQRIDRLLQHGVRMVPR